MLNRQGVLSLAFNGGKDCTVLLHLVIAALYHRLQTQNIKPIQSVYVTCRNPFPEVDNFVEECAKRYKLESIRVPAPMRLALQQFIDTVKVKPEAILVGIRRNDPYAGKSNNGGHTIMGLRSLRHLTSMLMDSRPF